MTEGKGRGRGVEMYGEAAMLDKRVEVLMTVGRRVIGSIMMLVLVVMVLVA